MTIADEYSEEATRPRNLHEKLQVAFFQLQEAMSHHFGFVVKMRRGTFTLTGEPLDLLYFEYWHNEMNSIHRRFCGIIGGHGPLLSRLYNAEKKAEETTASQA